MKKNPQMPSARRILGMVVGIVIIGLGIALFKQSHLGNDSISALNMRLAEMLGISLGVQNLCTNILFFASIPVSAPTPFPAGNAPILTVI